MLKRRVLGREPAALRGFLFPLSIQGGDGTDGAEKDLSCDGDIERSVAVLAEDGSSGLAVVVFVLTLLAVVVVHLLVVVVVVVELLVVRAVLHGWLLLS